MARDELQPFYVMPLYASSMRAVMRSPLDPVEALRLFADILHGVEAAHLQGVIHRDLKPENLLIKMPEKRVVVADFGVAHFEEQHLQTAVNTKPGARLANFRYSAPEQRKPGGVVDHRADIFALGLILNELFTGEVPQGAGYKRIAAVSAESSYLDDVVDKMIRQDPQERHASVASVKSDMELRGAEFVVHQKLDCATEAVVPSTDPEDPLGGRDVRARGFGYDPGYLTFTFEPNPPPEWMAAFLHLQTYRSFPGLAEPRLVIQTDEDWKVGATPETADEIAVRVKEWTNDANVAYRDRLKREASEKERRRQEVLKQQRQEHAERARALERLRLAQLD